MKTHSGKAEVTLEGDRVIVITREFDAPKDLVWRTITEPGLVRRWWGAKRGRIDSIEIDLRVGGTWRYVMTSDGGMEVGFHGTYEEIVPNEKVVSTEAFEGIPDPDGNASLNTVTLAEADGRTTMTTHVLAANPQARDAQIESGMEEGMQESFDAFEEVARSLA